MRTEILDNSLALVRNSGFYALEGLDGVGKSTVTRSLRDQGFSVLTTPPEVFKKYRPYFEHTDIRLRFLYYLFGVMYAGHQANRLQITQNVISDRYLLTTVAAHEAMGVSPKWMDLCNPLLRAVEKPANTFLITCDESERLSRLMARGANTVDLSNFKINDKITSGYQNWSKRLGHRLTEIDSTGLSPRDVALTIQTYTQR